MRSTATQWAKGSILAVDAGSHLASIVNILEDHLPFAERHVSVPSVATSKSATRAGTPVHGSNGFAPLSAAHSSSQPGYFDPLTPETRKASPSPKPEVVKQGLVMKTGPFADLSLPYETPNANAAHLLHSLISTYLVTHPHIDHLSGLVINTAGFHNTSRPKKVAALPATIDAIKTHIFNDVIWPNLSDEEGGVGLVSYMRLVEGGNLVLGEGDGKGYIEVCEGLTVKCWSISHGHCMKRHRHSGSAHGGSLDKDDRFSAHSYTRKYSNPHMSMSQSSHHAPEAPNNNVCVIDSSAFFIRDDSTGKEVLIFGDVEPDIISLSPRTLRVWSDAAPKIAAGLLTGIFIECSYDDARPDELLFGHLAPRHLIAELQVLADGVRSARRSRSLDPQQPRKRKRPNYAPRLHDDYNFRNRRGRGPAGSISVSSNAAQMRKQTRGSSNSNDTPGEHDASPLYQSTIPPISSSRDPADHSSEETPVTSPFSQDVRSPTSRVTATATARRSTETPNIPTNQSPHNEFEKQPITEADDAKAQERRQSVDLHPLLGVHIVIIHVKDTLKDGPTNGEMILEQLRAYEEETELGCSFVLSRKGESIWL